MPGADHGGVEVSTERAEPPTADPTGRASWLRDQLANDRTLLAWVRTGITLVALGFVVARFNLVAAAAGIRRGELHGPLADVIGVLLALAGGGVIALGLVEHASVRRRLRALTGIVPGRAMALPVMVATAVCIAGAVAMALFLALSRTS